MGEEEPVPHERRPFSFAFRFLPEDFSMEVVRTALQYRPCATEGVRNRMNGRLRRLPVPGFRDSSLAAPAQLASPAFDAVLDADDRLAGIMLRCWEEANAPLRDVVAARLADEKIELCTQHGAEQFSSMWPMSEWVSHRAAILETHGELSRDAVGLMLMVLTGRCPVPTDVPEVVTPRLRRWLDELHALPATAPEWADAEGFAQVVSLLSEVKGGELAAAVSERRQTAVKAVVDGYADELAYLDVDLSVWTEPDGRDPLNVALLAEDLAKVLAEYRPLRQQARLRADEKKRAVQRDRCEEAILEIVARWQELPEDASEAESPEDDGADLADEVNRLTKELAETKAEFKRLDDTCAETRKENQRLDDDNQGLRLSRKQLDTKITQVRAELVHCRQAEERWRLAYVSACKLRSVECDAVPEVANVKEAVELAKRAFPEELLVALNGKSDLGIAFGKPGEVFDALAWLATCYRRHGSTSINESCPGWSYKPDQTDSTMGRYREWYETSANGRTFEVSNHLGKGASFDPKSTIRIGFAWDDAHSRVIVGYVGRHQRTA